MAEINIKPSERLDNLECGDLKIIQDKAGYTFTMDSVLLANRARANYGDRIIDLGTGSGVIPLLLSYKTTAKEIFGIEIQERLHDMASRSVLLNGLENRIKILNCDIKNAVKSFGKECFDMVVSNPPYMKFGGGEFSEKDICKREVLITLNEIIAVASQLLKFGGNFFIVYKAERLTDLMCALRENNLEPKRITPVQPTPKKQIDTVIIEAKKQAQAGLILEKPLLVFDENGEYSEEIKRIYKQ
ncbi:MAG: tRNA1(Val) (adenine(37)-N6)-methyltransferase [Firmicutes bacterium]|nr:tRNA1(Val) (adenine(37)-N6)-methyltransferase [Bacillota bacterium]